MAQFSLKFIVIVLAAAAALGAEETLLMQLRSSTPSLYSVRHVDAWCIHGRQNVLSDERYPTEDLDACKAKCDAVPRCNFFAYGYTPGHGNYRCATFMLCEKITSYHDGDSVRIFRKSAEICPDKCTILNVGSNHRIYSSIGEQWAAGVGARQYGDSVDEDQLWSIQNVGDWKYAISNAASGRRLYAKKDFEMDHQVGAVNGSKIYEDQKWSIVGNDHGYVIKNLWSERRLYAETNENGIDVCGATKEGSEITDNQVWIIAPFP